MFWITQLCLLLLATLVPASLARPISLLPALRTGIPSGVILKITVSGKTHTLGERLGEGDVDNVYAIGASKVAKKFETGSRSPTIRQAQAKLYKKEAENTRKVLGSKMSSGDSQINAMGEMFSWIITPRLMGTRLEDTDAFKRLKTERSQGCVKFLEVIARPEFERKWTAFGRNTGLLHMDANRSNTFWSKDGRTITGFVDYEEMLAYNGPDCTKAAPSCLQGLLTKVRDRLKRVPKSTVNVHAAYGSTQEELAHSFALEYYPNELCR